jgi:hypothetical protein
MDITTIILLVIAICGLVYFVPKLPAIAQLIVAIIVVVACLIWLARLTGISF